MITVKYSCAQCGLVDRDVIVPERGEEDVVTYVRDIIGACVGDDHQRISPHCQARKLTHVKIPLNADPNARVGTKPTPG